MCGIGGFISDTIPHADLQQRGHIMADAISHRGPDSSGVWVDSNIGLTLAHRRLAIQDLSEHGHQPMVSNSGRYVISYNGEVYNFKALKNELIACGCTFSGESDTEVILTAFEQYGIKQSLSLFTGMFAFACWDRQDQYLYLCRDRLGEKPLYYGWADKQFVFASELKAIRKHLGNHHPAISVDSLTSYMRFAYVPEPYSIYQNIYKLPAGSLLALPFSKSGLKNMAEHINRLRSIKPEGYWSLQDITHKRQLDNAEESEQLENLKTQLQHIISQQMIADVPIGTFLSGGIDSTLVTSIAQSLSNRKINTFTIGFGEENFNEAIFAKQIAGHLGTNHHELYITPKDTLDVIPKLADIYDEPFADSSQIPSYLLSKFARQHVTVCLSGDGGDEFYCGYNRYTYTDSFFKSLNHYPDFLKRMLSGVLSKIPSHYWDKLYSALSKIFPGNTQQSNVGLKLHKLAVLLKKNDLFDAYLYLVSFWDQPQNLIASGNEQFDLKRLLSNNTLETFIEQAMYADQLSYLPGDNLCKVDRASMAVSLETRLPLLDHKLVEHSWSLPLSMKLRNNQTKWLLRHLLYQYVPAKMIERPKMGFSVPIGAWLRRELKDWAQSLLFDSNHQDDYLNAELVTKTWEQHQANLFDHSQKLWTVLIYRAWLQHHKRYG